MRRIQAGAGFLTIGVQELNTLFGDLKTAEIDTVNSVEIKFH